MKVGRWLSIGESIHLSWIFSGAAGLISQEYSTDTAPQYVCSVETTVPWLWNNVDIITQVLWNSYGHAVSNCNQHRALGKSTTIITLQQCKDLVIVAVMRLFINYLIAFQW